MEEMEQKKLAMRNMNKSQAGVGDNSEVLDESSMAMQMADKSKKSESID